MSAKILQFCTSCNPKRHYQRDRRQLSRREEMDRVLAFPDMKERRAKERRARKDRRRRGDRRIFDRPLPKGIDQDRRQSKGRRLYDGHAWFEGMLEEAVNHGWVKAGKNMCLCPRCVQRRKEQAAETTSMAPEPPKQKRRYYQKPSAKPTQQDPTPVIH